MTVDAHSKAIAQLTRAVAKIETAQESRDDMIVASFQAEVPVPRIAAAVGLSRARVYQIIQSRRGVE